MDGMGLKSACWVWQDPKGVSEMSLAQIEGQVSRLMAAGFPDRAAAVGAVEEEVFHRALLFVSRLRAKHPAEPAFRN